jgi:hypothetical protein
LEKAEDAFARALDDGLDVLLGNCRRRVEHRPRRPRQIPRPPTRQARANPARSISARYQESADCLGPFFLSVYS